MLIEAENPTGNFQDNNGAEEVSAEFDNKNRILHMELHNVIRGPCNCKH